MLAPGGAPSWLKCAGLTPRWGCGAPPRPCSPTGRHTQFPGVGLRPPRGHPVAADGVLKEKYRELVGLAQRGPSRKRTGKPALPNSSPTWSLEAESAFSPVLRALLLLLP